MITKREAAIITAYTGIVLGSFGEAHKFIEEILGRSVWTHELANNELWEEIKEKAKPHFIAINENIGD